MVGGGGGGHVRRRGVGLMSCGFCFGLNFKNHCPYCGAGETMKGRQWVQYKNDPQGEKWEVFQDCGMFYRVLSKGSSAYKWDLPKSEYVLCTPPERWEDVTKECEVQHPEFSRCVLMHNGEAVWTTTGYRLRKVQFMERGGIWAFVVEKKVSE